MPDPRPLRPGDPERLGGYRLIGLLGEGGQGVVYLGEAEQPEASGASETSEELEPTGDDGGSRLYAVKLLRTHLSGNQRARRYFAKEVAAAQRIDPSFTARIVTADVDGETPYIVSEYVDGRPLSEVVERDGPITGEDLRRLAVGTLNALAAIHTANIVHRDFKPSNVLVTGDRPRVIDFGVARALDLTASVSSGLVGTPVYMAPEQLSGQDIGAAADMFAWAGTMIYAATGSAPFGQDSIPAVMHRILSADPAIGDIRGPLRELVWYGLAKHPRHRPTAQQALDHLNGVAPWSPPASEGTGGPGTTGQGTTGPGTTGSDAAAQSGTPPYGGQPSSTPWPPAAYSPGVPGAFPQGPYGQPYGQGTQQQGGYPQPQNMYQQGTYQPGSYPQGGYPQGGYPQSPSRPAAYPPNPAGPGSFPPAPYGQGGYAPGGYGPAQTPPPAPGPFTGRPSPGGNGPAPADGDRGAGGSAGTGTGKSEGSGTGSGTGTDDGARPPAGSSEADSTVGSSGADSTVGSSAGSAGAPVRRWLPVAAAVAGVVLVVGVTALVIQLTGSKKDGSSGGSVAPSADAALTGTVNASTARGGTLRIAHNSDFDSLDPADMYYTTSWNFLRLYARPLVTYRNAPGPNGLRLAPDLADGLGQPSADLKTWTYHLRSGVTFEDGTPVTAKDVRYAVARTFSAIHYAGPSYFRQLLDAGGYTGADRNSDLNSFTGVTTPDDRTVVFHLKQPYSEFDYLAALPQTAPVPQSKDTGADYKKHPVATGPYQFSSYEPGKSIVLVRNGHWTNDDNRRQLPDRVEVSLGVAAADVDQRLLSGQIDLDATAFGLQDAARAKVLADPVLKRNTDNPTTGFLRYVALNTKVAPLDNVHCRRAVQYAIDRGTVRTAFGGDQAAAPATSLLPPNVLGRQEFERYPASVEQAKSELGQCGKPGGFSVRLAVKSDRPIDQKVGQAIMTALAKVGITVKVQQYPSAKYWSDIIGKPDYVHKNDLGMSLAAWGPDYPTGLGFFPLLVDGRKIAKTGNTNVSELNDAGVNGLLDQMTSSSDANLRERLTADVDRKVMEQAVLVPLTFDKTLLYRGTRLTNAYINPLYTTYDLASLGVTK